MIMLRIDAILFPNLANVPYTWKKNIQHLVFFHSFCSKTKSLLSLRLGTRFGIEFQLHLLIIIDSKMDLKPIYRKQILKSTLL